MAAPTFAHVGVPEGRAPFVGNDGLQGGGSTWGIVLETVENGERVLNRVCEEAIGQPPTFFHQRQDGTVLMGTQNGLLVTPDGGCTIEASDTILEGRYLNAMTRPQGAPQTLYVVTATPEGNNGFFKSTDDGTTFQGSSLAFSPLSFRTIVTNRSGQHVYVSAVELETSTPKLFVSHDFGVTFEEETPGFPEETQFILVLDYDDYRERVALVPYDGGLNSQLYFMDQDATTLTPDQTFNSVITDYLATKTREYVIVQRQFHFQRARGESDFVEAVGPVRCLVQMPGDDRHIWGCGLPFQSGHFLQSLDGVNFKPKFDFLEVRERECPAGTTASEPCAYLFDDDDSNDVIPFIVETSNEGDANDEEPNCAQGATLPSIFGLALLALQSRRRRD